MNHLKLTTISYGLMIPRDDMTTPIEVLNPNLQRQYDLLYILTDQQTEPLKNKGFIFKLSDFFEAENEHFARVYLSMAYCDPYVMPYETDGWLRGRQLGLRGVIFNELNKEYLKKIEYNIENINCLLSNDENIFNEKVN